MHDEVSIEKKLPNRVDGTLRKFALRVPECIYKCSGIIVFGKRIKSLVFSTDLSIIRNVNADAIMAVYLHAAARDNPGAAHRGGYPRVLRRRRRTHAGAEGDKPCHVCRDAGRDRRRAQ